MMLIITYFVKWLILGIVFTLSFILLNLVTTTSKDMYELPRCYSERQRMCFVGRCLFNVFYVSFIIVLHALSIFTVHARLLRVTLNINQSINQSMNC